MSRVIVTIAAGAALVCGAAALSASASATPGGHASSHRTVKVCSAIPAPGYAACLNRVLVDPTGRPVTHASPAGYGPADIQAAYGLTGLTSHARTVAIVDAYDDPTAAADLTVYCHRYGLSACTTSSGCLRKVNQSGGTRYPAKNAGWATEISLDLDMVSATCPSCKILLVEANTPSFTNLGSAVNYAASQGVSAISNSYGGTDSSQRLAYNHPGIAITASTGDSGYGVQSPASFDSVVAVGGTSLRRAATARGWTETAWRGAGSGCSRLNAKPSWQTSATQCSGKANADVSAVADPSTGVAVYDSTPYRGASGWQVYGGTSASAPIIASVYALSGRTARYPASYPWSNRGALNDVISGSNGSCAPSLWCHAQAGWDGPTGLGTPNGTAAF